VTQLAPARWTAAHTLGSIALLAALVGVAYWPLSTRLSWLIDAAVLVLLVVVISAGVTGSPRGVLIDDRNRLSLSRLQTMLWTLLIVSAFSAAAVGNVRSGVDDPLTIGVPEAVWMMLGISTVSFVGSPLILSTKRTAPAAAAGGTISPMLVPQSGASTTRARALTDRSAAAVASLGQDPSQYLVEGTVVVCQTPAGARWSDLFRGDEETNIGTVDLGKIQLFLFTFVVALVYAAALASTFAAVDAARALPVSSAAAPVTPKPAQPLRDPRKVDHFPLLDLGFVTLLGISNAGYLGGKAVPRPAAA
jgi:hypothetical protein